VPDLSSDGIAIEVSGMTVTMTAARVVYEVTTARIPVAYADTADGIEDSTFWLRNRLKKRFLRRGGGGGIRTLERPVTSNGFRDRRTADCKRESALVTHERAGSSSHGPQEAAALFVVHPEALTARDGLNLR
jgi:hypothetical protein